MYSSWFLVLNDSKIRTGELHYLLALSNLYPHHNRAIRTKRYCVVTNKNHIEIKVSVAWLLWGAIEMVRLLLLRIRKVIYNIGHLNTLTANIFVVIGCHLYICMSSIITVCFAIFLLMKEAHIDYSLDIDFVLLSPLRREFKQTSFFS